MKNKIISALGIGVILQWLSLFLLYRELPNVFKDINKPITTGGFLFKNFRRTGIKWSGGWLMRFG